MGSALIRIDLVYRPPWMMIVFKDFASPPGTNPFDWYVLATVTLAPGQNQRVDFSAQSNGSVAADASLSAATWQPLVGTAGDYGLYLKWPYDNQLDPAAYTIVHEEGTSPVED